MATREATAFHEAGHAVMCWLKDVKVRSVTIVPDHTRNADGWCHHHNVMGKMRPDLARTKGIKTRLEKLARISLAGTAAQHHFSAKSYRRYHGASDMQNVVDLISHLCQSERELNARVHLLKVETEQWLVMHWPLVKAVALALSERKTLHGWKIEAICGETFTSQAGSACPSSVKSIRTPR